MLTGFSDCPDIVIQKAESKWGEGFYKGLSQDLQDIFPDIKGFSICNLQYMKQIFLKILYLRHKLWRNL
ncbi:DUF1016 N-terminal domain-containing protein [Bacteroides caecimuris]|uniref:DUF1016 N-terminal domain-containing protein n=1 Tax=Bacteroides caecimuris TaxID=1796613 RepID=UPI001C3D2CAF